VRKREAEKWKNEKRKRKGKKKKEAKNNEEAAERRIQRGKIKCIPELNRKSQSLFKQSQELKNWKLNLAGEV
jgi:hypothetical protein